MIKKWIISSVAGALMITATSCLAFAQAGSSAPPGTTTTMWAKRGWTVTSRLKDPGTTAGTQIPISATITYTRDGEVITQTSDSINLVVGESTVKQEWVSTKPLPSNITVQLDSASGPGGVELTSDGLLHYWVTAQNNGTESVFTFSLLLK